jgi:hypothetical protein
MNQIRQKARSTQPVVEQPAPETDMIQEDKCHYICRNTQNQSNLLGYHRQIPDNVAEWEQIHINPV